MTITAKLCLEDGRETVAREEQLQVWFESAAQTGSLRAAAEASGESYNRLLKIFRTLEASLSLTLIEPLAGKGKKADARLVPDVAKRFQSKGREKNKRLLPLLLTSDAGQKGLVQTVAVVGPAGSGKTALVCGLVQELRHRGWRVGVIERWSEEEGPMPRPAPPGPAGSCGAILSGPQGLTARVLLEEELMPEIVAATYLPEADLALVESREKLNLPSIDVFRRDLAKLPVTRKSKYLLAVTGDKPSEDKDWPYFPEDDLAGLADLIEQKILPRREDVRLVDLWVNERRVPMVPFVEEIIASTMAGLISTLKSCDQEGDIRLTIRRRQES